MFCAHKQNDYGLHPPLVIGNNNGSRQQGQSAAAAAAAGTLPMNEQPDIGQKLVS